MLDKSLKDMTFEDFCRTVFNTKDTFQKPEVMKGIRVISTTQYILGPCVPAYLAELGAEAIKVDDRSAAERIWGWFDAPPPRVA